MLQCSMDLSQKLCSWILFAFSSEFQMILSRCSQATSRINSSNVHVGGSPKRKGLQERYIFLFLAALALSTKAVSNKHSSCDISRTVLYIYIRIQYKYMCQGPLRYISHLCYNLTHTHVNMYIYIYIHTIIYTYT